MSFAIFDEGFYLASYPDVKAAVDARRISSGFQHFQQYGLREGRTLVSPFYDEQLYLRKYPDVANAVRTGAFRSGLQHYIQYGEAESRSPGAFEELGYLLEHPDVASSVRAGTFTSGLQHYIQYGIRENRNAFFFGTRGNDVVTSAGGGNVKSVSGVIVDSLVGLQPIAGIGEADTLIGSRSTDVFFLGFPSRPGFSSVQFYIGNGNADFARIQNFERSIDAVLLPGISTSYRFQTVNNSLNISTASGDLIGVVEGIPSLTPVTGTSIASPLLAGVGPFFYLA